MYPCLACLSNQNRHEGNGGGGEELEGQGTTHVDAETGALQGPTPSKSHPLHPIMQAVTGLLRVGLRRLGPGAVALVVARPQGGCAIEDGRGAVDGEGEEDGVEGEEDREDIRKGGVRPAAAGGRPGMPRRIGRSNERLSPSLSRASRGSGSPGSSGRQGSPSPSSSGGEGRGGQRSSGRQQPPTRPAAATMHCGCRGGGGAERQSPLFPLPPLTYAWDTNGQPPRVFLPRAAVGALLGGAPFCDPGGLVRRGLGLRVLVNLKPYNPTTLIP